MTEKGEENREIKGLILASAGGECLVKAGVGNDRRVVAVVCQIRWLDEAYTRRVKPILLDDRKLSALVTKVAGRYLVLLSEPPTDTVLQFLMNVEFAYDILEHILTDPYDGMAIIDSREHVAFISPVHENFFGLRTNEGIGKHVSDVIENTRLPHVLRTGIAEVGQVQRMKGRDRIVSRHPIRHQGTVVGAIGRIMFKGPQQVEAMARRISALEDEIANYKTDAGEQGRRNSIISAIIGKSPAIESVRAQIRKIAPLDIPVLIQGASGTGKELVAQALHRLSPRCDARLITVNASALPESLVESELFGYEAGSFTGALKRGRAGKFELADKGTIFLDEIGDMPLNVQTKLLRVLQDHVVERVGGEKPKRVDFRLCSATNHDLEVFVEEGKFRLDLFYRICPIQIYMPTLEERLEDIPLLLNHFVSELAGQYNRRVPEIDVNVCSFLMEQSWPGNVRQLRHAIERALVFTEHDRLTVGSFTSNQYFPTATNHANPRLGRTFADVTHPTFESKPSTLTEKLESIELNFINDAMIRCKGNKKKTAEYLGISRSYLYKKLKSMP